MEVEAIRRRFECGEGAREGEREVGHALRIARGLIERAGGVFRASGVVYFGRFGLFRARGHISEARAWKKTLPAAATLRPHHHYVPTTLPLHFLYPNPTTTRLEKDSPHRRGYSERSSRIGCGRLRTGSGQCVRALWGGCRAGARAGRASDACHRRVSSARAIGASSFGCVFCPDRRAAYEGESQLVLEQLGDERGEHHRGGGA